MQRIWYDWPTDFSQHNKTWWREYEKRELQQSFLIGANDKSVLTSMIKSWIARGIYNFRFDTMMILTGIYFRI